MELFFALILFFVAVILPCILLLDESIKIKNHSRMMDKITKRGQQHDK